MPWLAAKGYRKLARLSAQATARQGFVMIASCSHHMPEELLFEEAVRGLKDAGRTSRLLRSSGAGPDHPVHPMLPESAYLKALVFALD